MNHLLLILFFSRQPEDPDPSPARKKVAKDLEWDDSGDDENDPSGEHASLYPGPTVPEAATIDDIRSVMLTRKRAAELCFTTFFQEYVKGMWVRVSVGIDPDDPKREVKYRVAEVIGTTISMTLTPCFCILHFDRLFQCMSRY